MHSLCAGAGACCPTAPPAAGSRSVAGAAAGVLLVFYLGAR